MRWTLAAVAFALAACAPAQATGPEAVVRDVYATATQAIEEGRVPYDYIPLTDELQAAILQGSQLAQQNNEPFLQGDLATGCQDCQSLTDLEIDVVTPPADGWATVEARFSVDGQARHMIYTMQNTGEVGGWRVANITSPDGYDLRASVSRYVADASRSCEEELGAEAAQRLVQRCIAVSPATHPPCNAQNNCSMIQAEIDRNCLNTASPPAECRAD
jgi:hypothetical protein